MRDLLEALEHVQPAGNGFIARCPAHEDAKASLSIGHGEDGRWLLKCHAGCQTTAIIEALGLTMADLFLARDHSEPEARYDYRDESGALLFQVVRFPGKQFRQRRPDSVGGWNWHLDGVRRVLYRLPDLAGKKTIFICEGEKDCDRLWSLGLPATTNAGGAGKWPKHDYADQLKAAGCRHAVVLPDNDAPGAAHGRDVARSCAEAGLAVKLIPLPSLPPKGDVSDFLATHSKEELLATVEAALLFDPAQRVAAEPALELTSLTDLLSEPDEHVDYLVEDIIPAGAIVLFAAPPKTGKSTQARELGFAVSRGEPWLGWRTTQGLVWMLIFEDKRSEVKRHFRQMGATGRELIRLFINQAPDNLVERLHTLARQERPALIIVDIVGRALQAKDFNDYAEITRRMEPWIGLSRDTGAALLLLHHGSAHATREGLDAVLGSTALSGSVDNILILKRVDGRRVLSSIQRIGPSLEPTIITFDPATGRSSRSVTKQQADDRDLGARILACLQEPPEPVSESWIQDHVEGRHGDKVRVLRRLVGMKQIARYGAGGRRDPYRYALVDAVVDPPAQNAGTPSAPENPDLFSASKVLVPEVPSIYREQENKNFVRTDLPPHVDVLVPQVPEVPASSGNNGNHRLASTRTAMKPGLDSGSREGAYERF